VTERQTERPNAPTLELVQAARLCSFKADDGWPAALSLECIAWLQAPQPEASRKGWTPERRDQLQLLKLAADAGELNISETTAREQVAPAEVRTPDRFTPAADWPKRYTVGGVPYAYERPEQYREVTRRWVTAEALAAWMHQHGGAPSGLIRAWFTACGVQAGAAQQEPAPAAPTPEASADIAKRAAMAEDLRQEWPSIEADLNDASRNGLREAAYTGTHGFWFADKAREWARQRGKLRRSEPPQAINTLWSGAIRRHTMKG